MPIEVKETTTPNEIKLEIIGTLDENGGLPDRTSTRIIRIDLKALKSINSIGIRNFLRWGDLHKGVQSIRLENCPSIFVKNFSMIGDFLKSNMKVMSFFVPFYSEMTGESKDILFVKDRDFHPDGNYVIPVVKDSKGHDMVLDVEANSFFRFLKP